MGYFTVCLFTYGIQHTQFPHSTLSANSVKLKLYFRSVNPSVESVKFRPGACRSRLHPVLGVPPRRRAPRAGATGLGGAL